MWSLLVEATGQVLQSNTPLLFSLFSDFTKHAPVSVPETPNLQKMKSVASQVGAVGRDGDAIMLQNILADMEGTASEQSWDLAPFLFVACMASKVWKSTNFNVYTGGFTTNVYCLSRFSSNLIYSEQTFEYNLDTGLASRDVSVTFDPTQRGCGGLTDV
jgi:NCK-associated protein 1